MGDFLEIMIFFSFDLDEATRYVEEQTEKYVCPYSREFIDELLRESCVD